MVLAGCGRIGFDPTSGGGNGDANGDADTTPSDGLPDGAAGAGTITGQGCSLQMMSTVAAAYVAGNVEFSNTAEIILFDAPVACEQLCATSWDSTPLPGCLAAMGVSRVAPGTQFVRFTMGGNTPQMYMAGNFDPPTSMQAHPRHYQIPLTGNPTQCDATGGDVTITSGAPMGPISGTFTFTLPSTMLTGTFDAAWCPTGWYP